MLMAKASFFGTTPPKIIIPLIFLAINVYGDLFAPRYCEGICPTTYERLISSISNLEHVFLVLIILLMSYYFSCSVAYFLSGEK